MRQNFDHKRDEDKRTENRGQGEMEAGGAGGRCSGAGAAAGRVMASEGLSSGSCSRARAAVIGG